MKCGRPEKAIDSRRKLDACARIRKQELLAAATFNMRQHSQGGDGLIASSQGHFDAAEYRANWNEESDQLRMKMRTALFLALIASADSSPDLPMPEFHFPAFL